MKGPITRQPQPLYKSCWRWNLIGWLKKKLVVVTNNYDEFIPLSLSRARQGSDWYSQCRITCEACRLHYLSKHHLNSMWDWSSHLSHCMLPALYAGCAWADACAWVLCKWAFMEHTCWLQIIYTHTKPCSHKCKKAQIYTFVVLCTHAHIHKPLSAQNCSNLLPSLPLKILIPINNKWYRHCSHLWHRNRSLLSHLLTLASSDLGQNNIRCHCWWRNMNTSTKFHTPFTSFILVYSYKCHLAIVHQCWVKQILFSPFEA